MIPRVQNNYSFTLNLLIVFVQEINLKSPKIACGWGGAPDPARGAYDAPPDPLIGFARALRALGSRASRARYSGASRLRLVRFVRSLIKRLV